MVNPYRSLPRAGAGSEAFQEFPAPILAKQRFSSENATNSSVVSFTDNTVQLEIAAVGAGAAIKWIASTDTQASIITAAGTANYDHVIAANTVRRFAIPQETNGTPSIVGAGVQNGLYRRVAWRSLGVGSIMSSEF